MTQTAHPLLELNSKSISRLVQLFRNRNEELRFPDVDAEILAQMVSDLENRREAVEAAQVTLGETREALILGEQDLLAKARKAHAYATVFAVGNEELEAELSQIKLNTNSRTTRKRRPMSKKSGGAAGGENASARLEAAQQELSSEIAAE